MRRFLAETRDQRREKRHRRGSANMNRGSIEERGAQEELRRSEERFELLVRSVKDYAIFMLDPEGRVVSWNEGAERIKGYPANEILGKSFTTFYPKEAVDSGFPQPELDVAKPRRSLRRRRLAGAQGWLPFLGQRNHHRTAQPRRSTGRLCQSHARPDGAARGRGAGSPSRGGAGRSCRSGRPQ